MAGIGAEIFRGTPHTPNQSSLFRQFVGRPSSPLGYSAWWLTLDRQAGASGRLLAKDWKSFSRKSFNDRIPCLLRLTRLNFVNSPLRFPIFICYKQFTESSVWLAGRIL
jgi:hypothetical protein